MNKFKNEIDMKYIENLREDGLEVIKGHEISLCKQRICHNENGFYIEFDAGILLTPETRIYFEDIIDNETVPSEIVIKKCFVLNTATGEIDDVIELVKLSGNGYVVYGRYIIEKNTRLTFATGVIIPYGITIINFYFIGDSEQC